MRVCTIRLEDAEVAAVVTERGIVPVRSINAWLGRAWPETLDALLVRGLPPLLQEDAVRMPRALRADQVAYAPLYRRPRKICGIDVGEAMQADAAASPVMPMCYLRGDHTIIGAGDAIVLPTDAPRVTAAGQLGVIIGQVCRDVGPGEAASVIAGYCLVLDMTTDIPAHEPRCLTRAKNHQTFFAFGPELITPDEAGDVGALTVATYRNGTLQRETTIADMAFPPYHLVSFHSRTMPLYPGDVLCTGAPGAMKIEHGDVAECRIDGLCRLVNPVRRGQETGFTALASAGV